MVQRMGAMGRDVPEAALTAPPDAGPWLEVEVERGDERDPTPDRFRAVLDAAVGIVELNARVNP